MRYFYQPRAVWLTYLLVALDDDKCHFSYSFKSNNYGLKQCRHVKENSLGFTAHTAALPAFGFPLSIMWECEKAPPPRRSYYGWSRWRLDRCLGMDNLTCIISHLLLIEDTGRPLTFFSIVFYPGELMPELLCGAFGIYLPTIKWIERSRTSSIELKSKSRAIDVWYKPLSFSHA